MWHDIHTKFHEDWYRCSSSIKVFGPSNLNGYTVGITGGKEL
jgi:hypothetical protein